MMSKFGNVRTSEKQEQAAIVQLVETLNGKAWVLGTTRPAGDFRGTCQTPGIADLWITLPAVSILGAGALGLWWETKSATGRRSAAQFEFSEWCVLTRTAYGYGTCDAFIAWLTDCGRLKGGR